MMTVVLVFENDVLVLICWYAPRCGSYVKGKQSLYDELKGDWDMHSVDDLVMCMINHNGLMWSHIDGFHGAHRGYGVVQRNLKGRMSLEFCLDTELCVSNTWFKREEKRKVTLRMGENETEIDFVLIRKHLSALQNLKAIPMEI